MQTKVYICASLVALTTATSLTWAEESTDKTRGDSAYSDKNQGALTSQRFVSSALRSGEKEIKLSRLALNKSETPKIREFAQLMIDDHSKAGTELREIAEREGIPTGLRKPESDSRTSSSPGPGAARDYPPRTDSNVPVVTNRTEQAINSGSPSQKDRSNLDGSHANSAGHYGDETLDRASGAEFDRLYLAAMVKDHQRAVTMFEDAARSLPQSELQKFAQSTVPKLQAHLDHARRLDNAVTKN